MNIEPMEMLDLLKKVEGLEARVKKMEEDSRRGWWLVAVVWVGFMGWVIGRWWGWV